MRLVLADDHRMMRDGLAALIRKVPGVEIVGVASDGEEAVAQTGKLQPDVVLMDVSMPRMDGIQATHAITREWPHITVIGLTMHEDRSTHDAMLKAGAVKCLVKTGKIEELIRTVQAAVI